MVNTNWACWPMSVPCGQADGISDAGAKCIELLQGGSSATPVQNKKKLQPTTVHRFQKS